VEPRRADVIGGLAPSPARWRHDSCNRTHRNVVSRAQNGHRVRRIAEGSRQRWRYVQ
jgi:hypothetical protein